MLYLLNNKQEKSSKKVIVLPYLNESSSTLHRLDHIPMLTLFKDQSQIGSNVNDKKKKPPKAYNNEDLILCMAPSLN